MESTYKKLIDGNRLFSLSKKIDDLEYFKKLSLGQKPDYLWIGCSDSRVPANEITNTESGEMFVHRNIANLVVSTDINLLSVLEYAVDVLEVKHVIICGHYGCGGVRASMRHDLQGYVGTWLEGIKNVYAKHQPELDNIKDFDKRADRLTELNVMEQVRNLAKTGIVQKAWQKRSLSLHGWVYGINSGLITDLDVVYRSSNDLDDIYQLNVSF